jgi:nicotinate-nucleotide adenylyltransferase
MIIIGGSYNPLHIGHLYLAEEARVALGCEKVMIIPSYISAHKNDDTLVEPRQRLEMVRLGTENVEWITVEDCEIQRGGVSYTIDTVREIKEKYDLREKPGLVIGDDLIDGFFQWKEYAKLLEEVEVIVAQRGARRRTDIPFPHQYLNNKILPISSSDIREKIRAGGAYRFLLPEAVFQYIKKNKLYL